MAEGWAKPLAQTALLIVLAAGGRLFAQGGFGSLSGTLTDIYSKPLAGATVVLRNQVTGAEVRTTTTKGGRYRFLDLAPGDYSLEARNADRSEGGVEGIEVAAGHESRVRAALDLSPSLGEAGTALVARDAPAEPTKGDISTIRDLAVLAMPQRMLEASISIADVTLKTTPLTGLAVRGESFLGSAAFGGNSPPEADAAPNSGSLVAMLSEEQALLPSVPLGIAGSFVPQSAAIGVFATAQGACLASVASSAARVALQVTAETPKSTIEIARSVADSAALATPFSAAQLQALPLPERDWQSFILDQPEQRPNEGAESKGAARGAGEFESVTVDGVDTRLAFGDTGAGRMRSQRASLLGASGSEASIREVQSATGSAVLDGRYRGGLSIATERGGDKLHGQVFAFSRTNFWGAKNPFTQWTRETAPATLTMIPVFTALPYTASDQEMNWGMGLGSALRGHKLFWFGAVDHVERNDPGVSTVKHPDNFFAQPSNDQMQVLSARLRLSSANPVAAGVTAYSGMLETLAGLLGPAPRTSSQWTGFARGDWNATPRQRFALQGAGGLSDAPGGSVTRASTTYGTHSYASRRVDDQWILGRWEAFMTRNLALVTQASVGRHYLTTPPAEPSAFEQSLDVNAWGRLPQINVDSRYGFTIGNPARYGPGAYPDEHFEEAQEQLDWAHGAGILVRAGFDVRHNNDGTTFVRNEAGTYSYASVENFASDALAFAAFGLNGQLNPLEQHNCDETGKVWRDAAGTLHGLGDLPCYAYYSQTMGPTNWWLSTDDWASFVTAQWHPKKTVVASLALRWELEEAPAPIALLHNPDLPLTAKVPSLGSQWGPRAGVAWGMGETHWPVLRMGYGMYFGHTPNATFETALTQTGSAQGDLNFFMRPTDNLNAGGAPPFPYVLAGEPANLVKPGAVEFAPGFRNGEVHQGVASLEEVLPGHVHVEASAVASLGRRLPVTEDANIDPAVNPKTITYAVVDGNGSGPIKTQQITVPFFASWPTLDSATGFGGRLNPNYQHVTEIFSRANSTYEAAVVRITRSSRDGLMLHARYIYGHAMDWNPDESIAIAGPSIFDPANFREDYGTSDMDVRHSASVALIWEPRWKLTSEAGRLVNGWRLSGVGSFRSGLPYTMRTAGSLAKEFDTTGAAIVGLAPDMNGYGGDNRVYGVGRNTYRYPATWKADMRLAKRFNLGSMRQLELLAESFNLFNHQNVTELETVGYSIESGSVNGGLPTLNFLTGLKTGQTEFGQPLNVNATDFYRPRQIQFGVRLRF
ncbi:MAG: carboxypeptidase-like regulatory domain-containing protein [Terracidiphilus sp.]